MTLGWLAWMLLSALAVVAGAAVALRLLGERGLFERAAAALLVALGLVLLALNVAGYLGLLRPLPLGLIALALFAGVAAVALLPAWASVREVLRRDGATFSALRFHLTLDAIWLLPCGLGAVALGAVLERVWYLKTWSWDAAWYHAPITNFIVQNGSLRWIDSPGTNIQGYPRNLELLAAWNCIFPRDNRLDDSPQVIFLIIGALLMAAWARRFGVPRLLALGLAGFWLCMPPVFLEAPTNGNDIACGVLLLGMVYFSLRRPTAPDRWMTALCAGLYLGTKYTALLHLLVFAPVILIRLGLELWSVPGRRLRRCADAALSLLAALALGIPKYVQNALHTGNPFFPMDTQVPWLHLHWAGSYRPSRVLYIPYSEDPGMWLPAGSHYTWFFSGQGDFRRMVDTWFQTHPFFDPGVHTGGFGAIFRWLLLPSLGVTVGLVLLRRTRRDALGLVGLFALAVVVPAAYWPRYIVGAAMASVVAFAVVWSQLPWKLLQTAYAGAAIVLMTITYGTVARAGSPMAQFRDELRRRPPSERANVKIDGVLWPFEAAQLRDRLLAPGQVLAFDESAYFENDLFASDYHFNVVYVSSNKDPASYLARLRAAHARLVVADKRVEPLLLQAGAERVFEGPPVRLYLMPPGF